jgi:catalase
MPLPSDPKLIALADQMLEQFDAIFGLHPGFRPIHAKGDLILGTFTPSPGAAALTRAPHITRPSTPVLARFSNSTGVPLLPDNDPNANPHGLALRFKLAEHVHTDIIAHSTERFPAKDGNEFLELLRAIAQTGADASKASPSPIERFLGGHPAALAFVQPRPVPSSFATEAYFAITAFRFTNQDGVGRYGRYRIVPDAGLQHLDDATAKAKDANFLFDDLAKRLAAGPVGFQLVVQLAEAGDDAHDSTIVWPENRKLVTLGKIALTGVAPNNVHEQKTVIFDPIPRVDGIDPSDDPLLELRAAIYLMSGRRRRLAPEA